MQGGGRGTPTETSHVHTFPLGGIFRDEAKQRRDDRGRAPSGGWGVVKSSLFSVCVWMGVGWLDGVERSTKQASAWQTIRHGWQGMPPEATAHRAQRYNPPLPTKAACLDGGAQDNGGIMP